MIRSVSWRPPYTLVHVRQVSTLECFEHHLFTGSLLTDAGRLVHARVIPAK